jgi:multidrug resistance protein MdtO
VTILADLAPRPGRFRDAVSIGGLCTAIVVVSMTLRIPEAGLAAYLVFFAYRPDANGTIAVAVVFAALSILVVGLSIPMLGAVVDHPPARMALVAVITFVGMWLASATPLGPIASTLAMLLTFLVILPDVVNLPIPNEIELLTRGIGWVGPIVIVAMITIGVLAYLFGRNAISVVEDRLAERLAAVEARLGGRMDARAFAEQVTAAPAQVEDLNKFAGLSTSKADWQRLTALDRELLELMLAVAALDESGADAATRASLVAALADIPSMAEATVPGLADQPPLVAATAEAVAARIRMVGGLLRGDPLPAPPLEAKAGVGARATLSEPRHWQFATKVTLAAMACIALFTGLEWVSIHTCLITCYYVSEATLGESVHKMTLRMIGCLIGAAIAALSLIYLVPLMSDVGQLALLVFVVASIGGWIGVGSERIAYAGFQIVLAFFLVVLEAFGTFGVNFGPSYDFEPATGRIIGILLGSLACAFAFVALWPLPMRVDAADGMQRAYRSVAAGLRGEPRPQRAGVIAALGRARDLRDYRFFERAVAVESITPAWSDAIDEAFRTLAVAATLEGRRERAGASPVAGVEAVATAFEHDAEALAHGHLPPSRARSGDALARAAGADARDQALVNHLQEIAGCRTARSPAESSQPAPSL